MADVFRWLVDDSGFTPRAFCGTGWSDGLRWLHAGSDLLIGLAYVAIPLILLFFLRKRAMPFSFLIALFGAFILACGTGHLIESVMFQHPVYHLSGVVKAATAAVSWVTVIALIPAAPRVVSAIDTFTAWTPKAGDSADWGVEPNPAWGYYSAILAAVLAVVVRAGIDPFLAGDQAFVVPLLAVVAVAWYAGLGPALLALFLSMTATVYLFVEPRRSFVVAQHPDQLAVGLFLFAGVVCAALGEAQKQSRRKAATTLRSVMLKQAELEAEVARRERAEAEQRRAAALLAAVADTAPDLIFAKDRDGRMLMANPATLAAIGRPAAEVIGRDESEWVGDPAQAAAIRANDERVMATGRTELVEEVFTGPAGRRVFLSSKAPMRDAAGEVVGVVGVTRDITDRADAELALRASEATLRAFYDASPACMGVVEPTDDGDILHVYDNVASAAFLGVPPGRTSHRRASEMGVPAEVRANWLARYAESDRAGGPVRFEHRFDGPGGPRWLAATVCPLKAPFPRPRFCYLAEEVTDRKRADDALRASEERFRFLDALGEATRPAADPAEVMRATTERLGRHLGADRCAYADVAADGDRFAIPHDWTAGVPSSVGEYSLDRFGPRAAADMRAGRTLVLRDVDRELAADGGPGAFAPIGVKAIVCCPLVVGGKLVAMMAVHQARPRDWAAAEVALVEQVVERSWAHIQRVRAEAAVRGEEARYRLATEAIRGLVYDYDLAADRVVRSAGLRELVGYDPAEVPPTAGWWVGLFHPDDVPAGRALGERVLAGPDRTFVAEYRVRHRDGRWVHVREHGLVERGADGRPARIVGFTADVSAQKAAEAALRESEARFRVMADALPQLAWKAHPDGHIYWYNRRWYEYTGTAPADMEGWGWQSVHDPAVLPAVLERWKASLATETPFDMVFPLRGADGVFRPFLTRVEPVRDESGRVVLWVGSNTDISDQRRAEQAVRESEARFRVLAEAVPQIVWVTRPDGFHEYYNPRWYAYTGMTEAESLGWGWATPLHPDDRARAEARWKRSTDTGDPYEIEYRFRAADGSYRWFLGQALPQRDETGRVVRWFGTLTDIDDFKRLREDLTASEARFRQLADSMPQIVFAARPDGHVDYFNRRWYEYTGFPADGPTGDEGWVGVHEPTALPRVAERWGRSVRTGEPYEIEYRLRRRDGAWRWHLGRAAPVRDETGGIVRWYGTNTDIDDQKRAEAALRASEARFRDLADSMPQIVYVTRPDGTPGFINRRWAEVTGEADTAPEAVARAIHPDDLPALAAAWDGARAARTGMECEFRLKTVTDGYRWFLTRSVPVGGTDGGGPSWYGTSTDIDDQKRTQEELARSLERFRLLTEAIPQIVWNTDSAGNATYFNARWTEYTGITTGQAAARGWLAAVHPDDAARVEAAWRETVARGGGPFTQELRLRRADGAHRWFLTVAVPLGRADGTVDQWIGSMADIHDQKEHAATLEKLVADRTAALSAEVEERRKAEEAVGKQRQFLDVILENVADGIVACDEGGTLTLFNRATREFHGLPAEPLPPDQWAGRYSLFRGDGVTPMPRDEVPLFRALRGEVVRDAEMVIAPRDGSPRTLLANGQRLLDPAGGALGAVVSMRDITERKRADEQFRRFAEELQRSNGELEKFAYVASHDLQEPLRKIQAFGDRLATRFKDKLDDQGRDYLDRMQASAARMRQLINDLLAFSRVTTKTQPFSRVDLNRAAADAVDDLHDRIQQTAGVVDVGPLPAIDADPTQVRQLFQNLIGNALKFHKPSQAPRVTVRAEAAGEPGPDGGPPRPVVRVSVSDDGIGFEEKYLDRIFQVFQRLHGRGEYDGTGVGLAICRKIVDRHGGEITARSSPGRGATFTVTLPLRQPARVSTP